MNSNKAREYFSAYLEGSLDAGLRQSFERKLATDATVQAEYRAFVSVVEKLNALKDETIDVPYDLHETISSRLDRHVYDNKSKTTFALSGWWRSLALGGLATAAIIATIVSLKGGGGR